MQKLAAADIAFARVNDPALLGKHPHLRRISVGTPSGPATIPAPAARWGNIERSYGSIPALGEHTDMIRKEFHSS
jgi:formyl-CoA transferase